MGLRHLARQRALQLLYGLEFNHLSYEEGEADFLGVNAKRRKPWSEFARKLARKTYEERTQLDVEFAPLLERWNIERLPLTDRICLRMAICELKHFPDIPLRSTLDEYVELAKLFGGEESPKYINGVLNRYAEQYKHKDFERKPKDVDPEALTGSPEAEANPITPAMTEIGTPESSEVSATPTQKAP